VSWALQKKEKKRKKSKNNYEWVADHTKHVCRHRWKFLFAIQLRDESGEKLRTDLGVSLPHC
jgi:hypothetical protein